MAAKVHHSAICVGDVAESLRFYCDGLGLEVLMDMSFDGEWSILFEARSNRLRSVFLGDPADPNAGIVELVVFDGGTEPAAPSGEPRAGFFLLSFMVDVDETVARLAQLGYDEVRRIEQPSPSGPVPMAVVRDPDGVPIELIGLPSP
jgi:catechol 2,3-dioxygenase-like lactoylglutathione lyase family enzyme